MKGQIKVEFVLGVVVFAIIIFYVATQINTAFMSTNIDSRLDILKARSITLLDVITKDTDSGLALDTNNLNRTLILEWEGDDCNDLLPYDLGGYRLTIEEEGQSEPILTCGYVGISAIRTIVTRHVKITYDTSVVTKPGNITMEMW